jgi:hypothetical protein
MSPIDHCHAIAIQFNRLVAKLDAFHVLGENRPEAIVNKQGMSVHVGDSYAVANPLSPEGQSVSFWVGLTSSGVEDDIAYDHAITFPGAEAVMPQDVAELLLAEWFKASVFAARIAIEDDAAAARQAS